MRREREAMGLPPLPPASAAGSSSPAATVAAERERVGRTSSEELGLPEEGGAEGEADKLMWLVWPFQVWNLVCECFFCYWFFQGLSCLFCVRCPRCLCVYV